MRVVLAMDMLAEPHVSGEAPSRFRPFPRSNVLSALREPNPSIPCHFDDRRSPCGAKRVTHSKLMQVSVGSARFSTYTGMHQSMSICMLSVQSASIVSPRSLVWLVMRRCVSFFARTNTYSKKIAGTQKDIWEQGTINSVLPLLTAVVLLPCTTLQSTTIFSTNLPISAHYYA